MALESRNVFVAVSQSFKFPNNKTRKSTNNWLYFFGLIEENMDVSCFTLAVRGWNFADQGEIVETVKKAQLNLADSIKFQEL